MTVIVKNTPAGWRDNKATTGCILDVPSGATVVRGLSMPHSVRVHEGRVWSGGACGGFGCASLGPNS